MQEKKEVILEKCEILAESFKVAFASVEKSITLNEAAYGTVSTILCCIRHKDLKNLGAYLTKEFFSEINKNQTLKNMIGDIQKLITDDSIALCKEVETAMNIKAVEAANMANSSLQPQVTVSQSNTSVQKQMFLSPPNKREVILEKSEILAERFKVAFASVEKSITLNEAAYGTVSTILCCIRHKDLKNLGAYLTKEFFSEINKNQTLKDMIADIQKLITDDSIALCKEVETVMNIKAVEAGSENKELNEEDETCSLM